MYFFLAKLKVRFGEYQHHSPFFFEMRAETRSFLYRFVCFFFCVMDGVEVTDQRRKNMGLKISWQNDCTQCLSIVKQ